MRYIFLVDFLGMRGRIGYMPLRLNTPFVKSSKFIFAKELRKRATTSESILWSRLKRPNGLDYSFRRQRVIMGWIVDF